MKDFRKIQQQDLKLQIIDKLHPKRILAEKYISDRYNSAFNAQLAVLNASFRYDLPMRGLGSENPQRFFESCSTGVSAPCSSLPSAFTRRSKRRAPARPGSPGRPGPPRSPQASDRHCRSAGHP